MTKKFERGEDLAPEERDFIRAIAEEYSPEPMTGARRTAFDARLRERMQPRARGWLAWSSLAAAGAAALLAFALIGNQAMDAGTPNTTGDEARWARNDASRTGSEGMGRAAAEDFDESSQVALFSNELEAIFSDDDDDPELFEVEDELLPSEYAAIDDFFLEYVDEIDG